MGCCNNDEKNNNDDGTSNIRDYPEGVDACCRIRGRRCFCLPYDDPLMITAQVLSILAVFVSWIWWISFLLSLTGMLLLQVVWCCRQNRATLLVSAGVAVLSGLASVGVGIYLVVAWPQFTRCDVFVLSAWRYDDDDGYGNWPQRHDDYCNEGSWAAVSFVCGAVWFGIAFCILRFVLGGRHALWEVKHGGPSNQKDSNDNKSNDVVEPGAIPVVAAAAEAATAETVTAIAVTDKVDDAC